MLVYALHHHRHALHHLVGHHHALQGLHHRHSRLSLWPMRPDESDDATPRVPNLSLPANDSRRSDHRPTVYRRRTRAPRVRLAQVVVPHASAICESRRRILRVFGVDDQKSFEPVFRSTALCGAREGRMATTVWRPRVRIAVPDIDGANVDEKRREELSKKGTKRKRAPPTKGPCEHGVKKRSRCKVCRACPHGRQRSQCKECGGGSICEHGRQRSQCKECGGGSICEHGRQRSRCKECGGSQICEHGRRRSQCKECGGASICKHGRRRSACKECGGSGICEHGRQRSKCKECGGASICEHGRQRFRCKECASSTR
jgi:hypothetical protein